MNITKENAKARVYVIYTGGTIGMVPKESTNPASPLIPASKEDLLTFARDLGEAEGIYWEIGGLVDENGKDLDPLDSSDVNAAHWLLIAKEIEKHYSDFDGFVVLHGTDTMAFTASGLSFLLANLAKPVVITGSQLPICRVRTDAVQNLVNAMYIAGYKATHLPLVPEVTICFGDLLLRGNRTTKVNTAGWRGFDSPNYPPLGNIGEHIVINESLVRKAPVDQEQEPFYTNKTLVTDVMDIGLFPGLKASQLEALLGQPGLVGIVLRTFGAGNAPSNQDFLDVIETSIKGEGQPGKVLVNITQCNKGMVEMGLYAASSGLLERGVISGLDMTPEAALAKMMWILSTQGGEEIQTELQIDQRGEQSQSLFDVRYGGHGKKTEPSELVSVSARPSGQFRKSELMRASTAHFGLGIL